MTLVVATLWMSCYSFELVSTTDISIANEITGFYSAPCRKVRFHNKSFVRCSKSSLRMRFLLIFTVSLVSRITADLKTAYEWKYIDYQWESMCEKQLAIANGQYDHTKLIPYDAQVYKDGKVFITTPRSQFTNPASVSIISKECGPGGPLLRPYPSWEWHVEGNCSGITNALKVAIDKCDRLWIVDSGRIGHVKKCPAQVLAFCLKTNKLLLRHRIPKDVVNNGLLAVYDVETKGAHCEKTWVYIADLKSSGFVIFDGSKSWRLESECLKPDSANSDIRGCDDNIQPNIGTIGIVRIPEKFIVGGALVMWSFTAGQVCGISLPDVHNSEQLQNNITWYSSKNKIPSQVGAVVISKDGVAFSGLTSQENLVCLWLRNKLQLENLVELFRDKEYLNFISSVKTFDDKCGREWLEVFTTDFPAWESRKIDCAKVNFRILTAEIATLISCTACAPSPGDFDPVPIDQTGFLPFKPHNRCD